MAVFKSRMLITIASFCLICANVPGGHSPPSSNQIWIPDNRDGTYTTRSSLRTTPTPM